MVLVPHVTCGIWLMVFVRFPFFFFFFVCVHHRVFSNTHCFGFIKKKKSRSWLCLAFPLHKALLLRVSLFPHSGRNDLSAGMGGFPSRKAKQKGSPIPTQAACRLPLQPHSKAPGGQVAPGPCVRGPATPSMKRLPVASPGLAFQVPADELRGNLHPRIHPHQPWEGRGCCNNTF